jgi:hypothetical protein
VRQLPLSPRRRYLAVGGAGLRGIRSIFEIQISPTAQAGSGLIPKFPGGGNLATNFSKFPINATMAGPVYAAIPLRYAQFADFRPGSAQGTFSAEAGNFFALTGNSSSGRERSC